MTTETKRDLAADLAICEAASSCPLRTMPSTHSEYPYEICRSDFLDTIVASAINKEDAHFIAEAREGWPHAIRRALAAEAEVNRLIVALEDTQYHLYREQYMSATDKVDSALEVTGDGA